MPNYRMRNCTFKAIYYHSLYIVIHQCLYHLLFPNYRHQYSRLTPIYIHYFVIKLGVAYASLVSNRSSQNHGRFCQKSFPFFVFVLFFPLFFFFFPHLRFAVAKWFDSLLSPSLFIHINHSRSPPLISKHGRGIPRYSFYSVSQILIILLRPKKLISLSNITLFNPIKYHYFYRTLTTRSA